MNCERHVIAYYVTPHGFGHAVRSLEIIRHLLRAEPGVEVVLVSDLPDFLVEQNVGRALPVRRRRLDIGLVQHDSLKFDLEATLEALTALESRCEAIVAEEAAFLKDQRVDAVVADVPFLAIRAASECGVPAIGISNFTWDWIYSAYARSDRRWYRVIEWIRECYSRCDLFLQLPMHGDCSVCPRVLDVPLVARKAARPPEETGKILGFEPNQKVYLVSFAALEFEERVQEQIESIDGTLFLYKHPLHYRLSNGLSLDSFDLSYADVVAAVDGVITKPGYGIVSDCLAHGTPMVYTDRGSFPEYEVLVQEMERYLPTVYLPSDDLLAGAWEPALKKLQSLPRATSPLAADGAAVCARLILDELRGRDPDQPIVIPVEDFLDLHTFQPREVKDLLHDYLEAAREKGFKEVRIIHGKGSGVLRERVHAVLKNHPLVLSLRQADQHRGGWGATIVTLKKKTEDRRQKTE